jgi:hypothetical protein
VWAAESDADSAPSSGTLNGLAITCAVLAMLALADMIVVIRRRRREHRRTRGGGTVRW